MGNGLRAVILTAFAGCFALIPGLHAQPMPSHLERTQAKGVPDGNAGGRITRIDSDGLPGFDSDRLDLSLSVNIQFVPSAGDLSRLQEQADFAQELLCDATDGRVNLTELQVNVGKQAADQSDIWWRRSNDQVSSAGNHITMNDTAISGHVLAHEIGHYVLNLADSYRARTWSAGCDWGAAYEGSDQTQSSNTIMQTAGQRVCVSGSGLIHADVDPVSFFPWSAGLDGTGALRCDTDADCPASNAILDASGNPIASWSCQLHPFNSELGTPEEQDPVVGEFQTEAVADASWTGECPDSGSEAAEVVLTGRLVNALRTTCFDGDLDATEECGDDGNTSVACDMTGRPGAANMSGTASCSACKWNTSSCTLDTCGNGTTDSNEDCDPSDSSPPAQPTCADLAAGAPLGAGDPDVVVGCHANCTYDTSVCPARGDPGLGGLFASCGNLTRDFQEQCDAVFGGTDFGGATCSSLGSGSGTLQCTGCWYDASSCAGPVTCDNDGVQEPGEECDGSDVPLSCADLGLGSGMPSCNSNCTYSVFPCQHPRQPFDLTDFQTLRDSAQVRNEGMWVLDGLHRAGNRYERGESEHQVRAFASRVDPAHWTMLFVMDGEEFVGGVADGTPQEIARFDLEFDSMNRLQAVNGEAVSSFDCDDTPTLCPQLVLGSDTATATFGTPTNGAEGQTQATGEWAAHEDGSTPGALTLKIDFSEVSQEDFQWPRGLSPTQGFLRAEVVDEARKPTFGVCNNDAWCRVSWDSSSQRFESTEQSRRALLDLTSVGGASLATDADGDGNSDLASREELSDWWRLAETWGVLELEDPTDVVTTDPGFPAASGCAASTVNITPVDLDAPSQFIMVLDRSGSMGADTPNSSDTRLELMQDAARNEVELHDNRSVYDPAAEESDGSPCNDGMDGDGDGFADPDDSDCESPTEVGLLTFNHETCVDPDGNDVCVDLADIGSGMGQTPKQDYLDAIDALTPTGFTGIGLAMREAANDLDMDAARVKALVVLTDGENNRPQGIACVPPGDPMYDQNDEDCPFTVAEELRDDGVLVITVPVGSAADSLAMQEIANITGGEMLSAYRPDEVAPVFLHAYALSRGEKPIIARRDVRVTSGPILLAIGHNASDTFDGEDEVTIPVPVEQGAGRLNLLLSVRDQDSAQWDPEFDVRRPDGSLELEETDSRVIEQPTSRLIGIDDPVAGEWSVVVRSTHNEEKSHFAAHVENPLPGCGVELSDYVTDGTRQIVADVEAYYDEPLRHGDVDYSLVIKSIDGTVTEISDFDTNNPDAPARAVIEPSMIPYHGRYEVIATCDVGDLESSTVSSAVLRQGEVFSQADVVEIQSREVPAFTREDRTSLSVVNGDWPPLSNCANGDCDYDGIPNSSEDASDVDGDGVPAAWDDDADGDDVADSEDPDPSDPDVPGQPLPPGCSQDSTPPVISAPAASADGCVGDIDVDPGVVATDASCANDGYIELEGRIVAKNGQSLGNPVTVSIDDLALPAGSYTIEWTATDVNDNSSTATQSVTVNADTSSQALCCPAGSTVYNGNGWPNLFIVPSGQESCVLGRGLWDEIVSGTGADYLSGGANEDSIQTDGADDVVSGGAGSDVLIAALGPNGTVYGDGGHDVIELTGPGFISGGSGNDVITGAFGNQTIVPGPGVDGVYAKSGDDVVKVYDVCELAPLEVLEGGSGNDTLITPIPVADMLAMGVIVVGFENVIVSDAERHLSECL